MRKLWMLALSLVGLFDSIYLMWEYTSPAHPMVCMGGGCDVVRASSYSHIVGLPVPVFGMFMYAFVALLIFLYPLLPTSAARVAQTGVLFITGAAFVFSAYLTGLEAFVIHAWCMWCVLSALLVTAIFALAIVDRLRPAEVLDAAKALSAVQRNFAMVLFAFVLGVPAFIFLTAHGSLPPPKAPSESTVKARMVRPDTHFYGNPDSPVTVVEFGDFKCPACRAAESTAKKIREQFGNKIRFAFREFPLIGVHPESEKAAEAAECAAQQGKFWQAVDMFYEHQEDLSPPALNRYAAELGLDSQKFVVCLQKGEMASRVTRDLEDGRALGVHMTPTFFVNGRMMVGAIPYPQFAQVIQNELNAAGTAEAASAADSNSSAKTPSQPAEAGPAKKTSDAHPSSVSSDDTMPIMPGSANLLASFQNSAEACSEAEAKKRQPEMIGTSQAQKLYDEHTRALFVDVRPAKEFESGHIPGAVNFPIDSFQQEWKRLPKDKTIVLYEGGKSSGDICAFSRSAGRILLSQGFGYDEVKVYRDGLRGWRKAGLPIQP